MIDALLKASPKGAQSKDDQGRLPIHHACRRNSSERVIRTLLRVYPRAAQIKDDQDKLAVHYACNHGGSLEIVRLLIQTYPESINVRNGFGHTPLSEVENLKDPKMRKVVAFLKEFKKEHDLKAADDDVESQLSLLKDKVSSLERTLEQVVNLGSELKQELRRTKDPNRVLDDFAEKLRGAGTFRIEPDLLLSAPSRSEVEKVAADAASVPRSIAPSTRSSAHTSLGHSSDTPQRIRAVSKPRTMSGSRSGSRGRSGSNGRSGSIGRSGSKGRTATPGKKRFFGRLGGKRAEM